MEWIVRCPLFSLKLSFHQRIEKSKITLPKESERRKRKSEEEKGRRKKKRQWLHSVRFYIHYGYLDIDFAKKKKNNCSV